MKININNVSKSLNILFVFGGLLYLYRLLNQFYFQKYVTSTHQTSIFIFSIIWVAIYLMLRFLIKIYWSQERKKETEFISLLRSTCDSLEMISDDDQLEDIWFIYEPSDRDQLIEILKSKTKGKRNLKEAILDLNGRIETRESSG